jgi:hypothetical protein
MPHAFSIRGFYLELPLWCLAVVDTARIERGRRIARLSPETEFVGGKAAKIKYVALFTDEDLAQRHSEYEARSDLIKFKIDHPQALLNFLTNLFPTECTHVAIDPPAPGSEVKQLWTKKEVVEQLQKNLSEGATD